MKRLYVAIVLAIVFAAGATATAKAATVANFGSLGIGGSGLLARPLSNPLGAVPPGAFADDYLFQVASNAAGSAVVLDVENLTARDITGLTLALFSSAGPTLIDSDTGGNYLEVAAASLSAGVQYFVRVSGTAVGTQAGQYIGGLSIVPVPAALPLMLGALAGLGLIARRKTDA